jgi:diaminohydroxyphosphoribosylaminopyrimidine deaminase/5-amino-6-(5-phosphoribosylamino)uracil reductase
VEALSKAGAAARGATAYVSFEPCSHQGQTPPCARALVAAGIGRVVIGCIDPYPAVRGRGVAMLKREGVNTAVGVLEEECRRLNEGFITRVTRGRPFALLKLAASLDGRIAAASRDSRWISSAASREIVHQWRREADVVMVGAATDNPRLTCRLEDGRDPVRVVVDGRLRCPPNATVFRQRSAASTLIVTTRRNVLRARRLYGSHVDIIAAAIDPAGAVALPDAMRQLARRGYSKVLIEGGAHLAGAALRSRVVDRVAFFLAPIIIGCGVPAIEGLLTKRVRQALRLKNLTARAVGADWLMEGDVAQARGARRQLEPRIK